MEVQAADLVSNWEAPDWFGLPQINNSNEGLAPNVSIIKGEYRRLLPINTYTRFRGDCGYYARMAVPHALRAIVGKKELWTAIKADSNAGAVATPLSRGSTLS